jgi:adenosylcobinamide kinase/adenosylcobinamide-phosphate guanylyltransferase
VKITLLGTGAADGWPNPFCTCASCAALRERGQVRGQTSVLVDTCLLVDCSPEAPRAAARLGLDLAGVRHLLITSGHPDHAGPAALLWRSWASRAEPLDVVAPPSVVSRWRDWVGPDDPVAFRPVTPGAQVTLGRYQVRVLAAARPATATAEAVLYDVTAVGGGRLLYAAATGPLPEATLAALRDAAYDVVLLEETFGDVPAPDGERLDLVTFPAQLAELRRRGAVTDRTRVIAVHLGHHNPPPDELARRLAGWGAELLADGSVLAVGPGDEVPPPPPPPSPAGPRRVLVLGGARSGKSAEAERRLAAEPAVTYVATARARPDDPEWQQRVAAHRARRPRHWRTVETGDLERLLEAPPGDAPLLVDCLTLWLGDVLETAADPGARVAALVDAWRATPARVVAVSNEVGSGVVPATADGRRFRDLLGTLNARLAAVSDEVWLVTAGIARRLR